MSQFNKICLEKNQDRGFRDYNQTYKIDFDHYQKVLEAKWEKSILNFPANVRFDERNQKVSKDEIKEGDFISCCLIKSDQIHLGYRFKSYVQKDDKGLFVIEWRTYSSNVDASFIAHKYYFGRVGGIELIWRELEINSTNLLN